MYYRGVALVSAVILTKGGPFNGLVRPVLPRESSLTTSLLFGGWGLAMVLSSFSLNHSEEHLYIDWGLCKRAALLQILVLLFSSPLCLLAWPLL